MGWSDVELSEQGFEQAEKVAERFSSLSLKGLYSSDLQRAIQTAEAIGKKHGALPIRTPLLREINFGKWEGLTYNEIRSSYGEEVRKWFDDPFQRAPIGGETLAEVCQRMELFLRDIASRENEGTVVVVSHGGLIRSILHCYLKQKIQQLWEIQVDNASVSLLEKQGAEFKVSCINSLEHLESEYDGEAAC